MWCASVSHSETLGAKKQTRSETWDERINKMIVEGLKVAHSAKQ